MNVTYNPPNKRFSAGDYHPKANPDGEGKPAYILAIPNPFCTSEDLLGRITLLAQTLDDNGASRIHLVTPIELNGRAERGHREQPENKKLDGEGNFVKAGARVYHAFGIKSCLTLDSHAYKTSNDIFNRVYYGDKKAKYFNPHNLLNPL